MALTTAPHSLLAADVGDGLEVKGRRHPITHVGLSRAGEFRTREYTLGDDDYYLVLEGHLLGDGPGEVRAVLTHELAEREVRCASGGGRRRPVTVVLGDADDVPTEVYYRGRAYRYGRRIDATYTSPARSCPRVTWDFECGGRNVAVERWPEGEMAVYEGEVVPLESIRLLPNFRPAGAKTFEKAGRARYRIASPRGVAIGLVMIAVGFLLLAS